ncbi:hypothetical protein QQP08_017156 [Theobroma cacao]|nr:hypothetical protein QQP08_017156 [Theobroma cacao]
MKAHDQRSEFIAFFSCCFANWGGRQ